MSEGTATNDPGALWRDQPKEALAIELEQVLRRRADALHASTRSEILVSVGAGLLLAGVVAWRLAPPYTRPLELGLAAVLAWAGITLFWFRRSDSSGTDVTAPGVTYYRRELERRRDHLRNAWLWHGPLVLACLIFAAVVTSNAFPGGGRLASVLPLVVLLLFWTAFGLQRRRRQVQQLDAEIREIDHLSEPGLTAP